MSYDRPGRYERRSAHDAPRAGRALASLLWALLQVLLTVAVIGAGFAALRNVLSDTFEIERMAMTTACAERGPSCRAQMTRWERTAIGQTFDMYTSRGTVIVRCQREYYLVGDYHCTLRDMPAAIAAESPAPAPKPSVPPAAKAARK
jgi:hypothetical protein